MNISLNVDAAELLLRTGPKGRNQFRYAVVNGINDTVKYVQVKIREHIAKRFMIRKPDFFFGGVGRKSGFANKIDPFASVPKNRFYAEIYIDRPDKGGPFLLADFEEGGALREPFTPGAKKVAAPVLGRPARPSINRGVPPRFTFQGLKFRAYRTGGKKLRHRRRGHTADDTLFGEFGRITNLPEAGAAIQWKGLERTFIIPEEGVFQRIGPDRGDVRLIWGFIPPFPLKDRLDFRETAIDEGTPFFEKALAHWVEDALEHNARRLAA